MTIGYADPACFACHGGGSREEITLYPEGYIKSISYVRCECTFRPLVTHEEDWSNERNAC